MSQWTARIRTTHSTVVTVEAENIEEARKKALSPGDWIDERQDELIGWDDLTELEEC